MGVDVGLSLAAFPFSGGQPFWQWVQLCEEGGIDSIWQTDRLVSGQPHLECMSVMAALAGATKRVKFGMNVACLGWREPVLLAKQCATIDLLSSGRLLPAFGVGSPRGPEWKALGLPAKGHGARIDEALEIMRRLWTEESVDYDGTHYQLTGGAHRSQAGAEAPATMDRWIEQGCGAAHGAAGDRMARRHVDARRGRRRGRGHQGRGGRGGPVDR